MRGAPWPEIHEFAGHHSGFDAQQGDRALAVESAPAGGAGVQIAAPIALLVVTLVTVAEDEDVEAVFRRINQPVDDRDLSLGGIEKCHLWEQRFGACEVVVPAHRDGRGDAFEARKHVRADVTGVQDKFASGERPPRILRQFAVGVRDQSDKHGDSVAIVVARSAYWRRWLC